MKAVSQFAVDVCLVIRLSIWVWGRNSTEVKFPLDPTLSGVAYYQHVPLLVSAYSGFYSKTPQIESLRNNRNLFLRVLGAGSPRSSCQHIQHMVRAFWFTDSHVEWTSCGMDLSGLSYKGTNAIHESSSFRTKLPPQSPTSKYHHAEDSFCMNFVGGWGWDANI